MRDHESARSRRHAGDADLEEFDHETREVRLLGQNGDPQDIPAVEWR
jgi:hypothetical protein